MIISMLLLLLVVATAAAIVGLVIAALSGSKRRRLTGPVCGGCGYSVTGLTRLTCPECGGDLRTVGIPTSSVPQPRSAVTGAMMFTVLLIFIAIVATAGLESVVPVRHHFEREVQLGPVSSAYRNVVVSSRRASWIAGFTPAAVKIELNPSAARSSTPPARMSVYADGHYEFTTAGSKSSGRGEFDEGAVLDWLKSAGIDTSSPDIQRKAASIAAEARVAAHSGRAGMSQTSVGFSSGSSSGSDPAGVFQTRSFNEHAESFSPIGVSIAMLVFWLAVWVCGLWYLASRGKRRRRAVVGLAGSHADPFN